MTAPRTASVRRIARDYRVVLLAYLTQPDEEHLHAGYDLGRAALADGITLLDLTRTHHLVVAPILTATAHADLPATLDAAAAFLIEALAPYDIARSGFLEQTGTTPLDDPLPPR
jgi:hypothetical protein